jgi:hypothetical protein
LLLAKQCEMLKIVRWVFSVTLNINSLEHEQIFATQCRTDEQDAVMFRVLYASGSICTREVATVRNLARTLRQTTTASPYSTSMQSSCKYKITSWNTRLRSGFKIKWKNSSDLWSVSIVGWFFYIAP